jgi:hypothetical protein
VKNLRLMALFVLVATLMVFSVSASADEKLTQLNTSLGNTTISGSVNTTVTWQSNQQPQKRQGVRERVNAFFLSFRSEWLAWWEGPDSDREF